MKKAPPLPGPIATVETDGWTVQSSSQGKTAETLVQEFGPPEGRPEEQPDPEPLTPEQVAERVGKPLPGVTPAAAAAPAAPAEPEPQPEPEPDAATAAAASAVPVPAVAPVRESARQRRTQTRIDTLTRESEEARRENERLRAELEATRRGAPSLPAAASAPAAAPTAVAPAPKVEAEKPRPKWSGPDGYEAQNKSYEDYEQDRDEWLIEHGRRLAEAAARDVADKRWTERQQQDTTAASQRQRQDEQTAAQARFDERIATARIKYADFDAVMEDIGDLHVPALEHIAFNHESAGDLLYYFGQHPDQVETLATLFTNPKIDGPIANAIINTTNPLKILAHFAGKPAEFQKLLTKRRDQMQVEIGMLSARLDVAPAVSTPAVRVTKANPPLRTVDRGRAASVPATTSGDEDDFGPDYIARMNRQERERQRARGY